MNSERMDPERAEFEAWCCRRWGGWHRNGLGRTESGQYKGEYVSGSVEFAWKAWLASQKQWQRVWDAAQAVTVGGSDEIDYFKVPSHLMAALALALDETRAPV